MIEAGLAVVLATDFNPGSSPTPSIPMVLSLAATQMKMTPAEGVTRDDDQRRLQSRPRRQDRFARSRESWPISASSIARIIAKSPIGLDLPQTHSVYVRGERVL